MLTFFGKPKIKSVKRGTLLNQLVKLDDIKSEFLIKWAERLQVKDRGILSDQVFIDEFRSVLPEASSFDCWMLLCRAISRSPGRAYENDNTHMLMGHINNHILKRRYEEWVRSPNDHPLELSAALEEAIIKEYNKLGRLYSENGDNSQKTEINPLQEQKEEEVVGYSEHKEGEIDRVVGVLHY